MDSSSPIALRVDLQRIAANARHIAQKTGVAVYPVIKANAYGLGAQRVAPVLADSADHFCVFSLEEAQAARIWQLTGKPAIALGPPTTLDPRPWIQARVRPAVSTLEQAQALRQARPVLCVDTGMQRFACPPAQVGQILAAGEIEEAFTHAARLDQALRLANMLGDRILRLHAAGSALLDQPAAWLDAVRPGLALYEGAVHLSTRLIEARDTTGPVGYTGFEARRIGVILCGYSNGLRPGPCLVEGEPCRIREVGMQSAYVEIGAGHRVGDQVVLLGDRITPQMLAAEWACTPHEVLMRLVRGAA